MPGARWLFVLSLLLAALSLAPSYAHGLEAWPRLHLWPMELWRETTVFKGQFVVFGRLGGVIDVLCILVCALLTWRLGLTTPAGKLAGAATLLFAAGLAAWGGLVAPANAILATWTPGPLAADADSVRLRWETGHMIVASLKAVGLLLLTMAATAPLAERSGL